MELLQFYVLDFEVLDNKVLEYWGFLDLKY